MRNKKLLLNFSLCLATSMLSPVIIPQQAFAKEYTKAVQMIPASFADLAEKLSPAVVNISTTQKSVQTALPEMPQFPEGSPFEDFFRDFMERRGGGMQSMPSSSLGSGFIIDAKNGYIVTNNHVVRDAEDVRITLSNDITISAEIIGSDDKTDLAVLKVDPKEAKLSDVTFGNSDALRVGDWTLAIGNPYGLGGSVTTGIISARARDIQSGPYDDYLQTDASINRGNSGGPLFNMNGEVIGINTAIFSPTGGSIGIGFAIPSNMAKNVVNQIIKYGRTKRGWVGVRIQNVTDDIAETLGLDKARGALVADVTDNGPAKDAGLKSGDIILEFNGQKIEEMRSLPRIVAENEVGASVPIKYWRNEKEHTTKIKIGELEKAEEEGLLTGDADTPSGVGVDLSALGITVNTLTEAAREEFGIGANVSGVVITKVAQDSNALMKGLTPGDVIVEANQQPIKTAEDLSKILDNTSRKSILLLINSAGTTRFVALELKKD